MDEDSVQANSCSSFAGDEKTPWTKVKVAQLIDLYRQQRCLYDSHEESTREQRNSCISEIAAELGVPDDVVKRKVHNLRTAYAREKYVIEQRRSTIGKPGRAKQWCHYERLRFLDEVFSPKVWAFQPGSSADEHANDDSIKLELDCTEDHTPSQTVPALPAAKKRRHANGRRQKRSKTGNAAVDSDVLFGQFVAAELGAITDPVKKLYTQLQIRSIVNTAMAKR